MRDFNIEDIKEEVNNFSIGNNAQNPIFEIAFLRMDNTFWKIFKNYPRIYFKGCRFNEIGSDVIIQKHNIFYEDCTFRKSFKIICDNEKTIDHVSSHRLALYEKCTFEKDVEVIPYGFCDDEVSLLGIFPSPLFHNCNFLGKLKLRNVNFQKKVFNDNISDNSREYKMSAVVIRECIFDKDFILNNYKIEKLCSNDSKYQKFEFKNNTCFSFYINDCNFNKIFDCYQTRFYDFSIEKSIFDDVAIFEEATFSDITIRDNNDNTDRELDSAKFIYVTFKTFASFRKTQFLCGLDIERINLTQPPNFFNAEIEPKNTDRETFRIVKHSFDSAGNYIEGNKYFAYEMEKYREELKAKKLSVKTIQEKTIFFLNRYISNFGQNYLCPIGWIIISSGFFHLSAEYIKSISSNPIMCFLNQCAASILPFKIIIGAQKDMEFISLIFFVIFSALIWQTIVAIKRHTRR